MNRNRSGTRAGIGDRAARLGPEASREKQEKQCAATLVPLYSFYQCSLVINKLSFSTMSLLAPCVVAASNMRREKATPDFTKRDSRLYKHTTL